MEKRRKLLLIVVLFVYGLIVLSPVNGEAQDTAKIVIPPTPDACAFEGKNAGRLINWLIAKRISEVVSQVPRLSSGTSIKLVSNDYGTGISAGDSEERFGIWSNYGITRAKDDTSSREGTKSDTDLNAHILGVDYKISNRLFIGVAASYEVMDVTTFYNAGRLDSEGFIIAPYIALSITDFLSADVTGGYGLLNTDQKRNIGRIKEPGYGIIKSSLDSKRMFASANLKGFYNINKWNLAGNIGYLYASEEMDDYSEVDEIGRLVKDEDSISSDFAQITVSAELAYIFGDFSPYVSAAYEYDTTYEKKIWGVTYERDNYDREGFIVGGGIRFLIKKVLHTDIQILKVIERDDYDEYSIVGNLRFHM